MAERIPQSVAYLVVFRAFLASDGKTVATGKTIAITISKNGGAFGNPAAGATNATEISSGFYKFTLGTGDTDTLGPLAWRGAEGTINDAGDVLTVAVAVASQSSVDTIDDFLDTEVAAIKAKTDNLPSDPADASDIASSFTTVNGKLDTIDDFLDTEVAAIKAKTDNLPSDPADASDIASSFSTVNTKLDTIDDFLDTEVAAIKAKTDNLPSDPADASDISALFSTVNSTLATIAGYIDTEVGLIYSRIGAPLGASVSADILAALKLLKADAIVDTSTTPWALVLIEAGTGGIGVGTELLRKPLYDTAGGNIGNTTTVIGRAKQ